MLKQLVNRWANRVMTKDFVRTNANANGYCGCVGYDNFIFFSPFYNGSAYHGLAVKYDISNNTASIIDLPTLTSNAGAKGYIGCCEYNGKIYFAPESNPSGANGLAAVYDVANNTASIINLPTLTSNAGAKGYRHCCEYGGKIYFAPYSNGAIHGLAAVYDVANNTASIIDLPTLTGNAGAKGYTGICEYAGKIYFCPFYNSGYHGLAAVYDVANNTASIIDLPTLTSNTGAKGYIGCCEYQGKIYFAPESNASGANGLVAVYDVANNTASIINLPTLTGNAGAKGYRGCCVYNGKIYFAPYSNGAIHGLVAVYDVANNTASIIDLYTLTGFSGAKGFWGIAEIAGKIYVAPQSNVLMASIKAN